MDELRTMRGEGLHPEPLRCNRGCDVGLNEHSTTYVSKKKVSDPTRLGTTHVEWLFIMGVWLWVVLFFSSLLSAYQAPKPATCCKSAPLREFMAV